MTKNKTTIILATLLFLTFTISLIALPASNAHTPAWKMETWAYIAAAPNPVGVGQKVFINMWVDKRMPEATVFNDIRRHDYQLNITKPDGQMIKQTFDLSDTTGVQFYVYVPDQVGVYSCVFYYPGQVYTWNSTTAERVFTNDVFLPATRQNSYLHCTTRSNT